MDVTGPLHAPSALPHVNSPHNLCIVGLMGPRIHSGVMEWGKISFPCLELNLEWSIQISGYYCTLSTSRAIEWHSLKKMQRLYSLDCDTKIAKSNKYAMIWKNVVTESLEESTRIFSHNSREQAAIWAGYIQNSRVERYRCLSFYGS
jgi:hypothetical protein